MLVAGLLIPVAADAVVVAFPDTNLDAAVRNAIGKPSGDILDTDLVGVGFTSLSASGLGISDLSGLEFATDLSHLDLFSNSISDIGAISSLTQLTTLILGENEIGDLSPLTTLVNLEKLLLDHNLLTDISPLSSLTAVDTLSLFANQIVDITALASLTNLSWLDLDSNEIVDLTPLSSITNLSLASFAGNRVRDISPLETMPNLSLIVAVGNLISDIGPLVANLDYGGEGEVLELEGNPLSQAALCADIPTLEARGVTVNYNGACGDFVVPYVEGLDQALAEDIIVSVGLTVGSVTTEMNGTVL
jgi:internalin A